MADSSTAILSYQYRIYPNATQTAQLEHVLDVACRVYNDIAHKARLDYEAGEKWSWMSVDNFWRQERNKHSVIQSALPAESMIDLLKRYDMGMQSFWALRKNGHTDSMPPGEIKRHKFKSIGYRYGKGGIKFTSDYNGVGRLKLWAVDGSIRVHYHRPIPNGWKIKHCLVTKSKRDEWYVSLQCEGTPANVIPDNAVGIDLGLYSLLALSNGTLYENPRWYRQDLKQRRILQRKADRQRRACNPDNYNEDGTVKENAVIWRKSSRLRETERLLRKMDARIADQRRIWQHTATNWLADNYGLIAIEDLSPQFMIANSHLAMSANDAAWSTFVEMLEYKCNIRGVELVKVPARNTSQICSGCGEIVRKDLKVRVHRCVSCGLEIDRDVNAARNILNLAVNGRFSGQRDITQTDRSNVSRNG